MTAFFVATVTIKGVEKFHEYGAKAMVTFESFGGVIIQRGKHEGNFAGSSKHHAVGIVQFPSAEQMNKWFASEAYQAIIPLRNEAADMTITKYIAPDA